MIVISSTLGLNNLYCWAMSQNFPINNFDWIRDTSQLLCHKNRYKIQKLYKLFRSNSNWEENKSFRKKVDIA